MRETARRSKSDKTEVIGFKVTPREKEIIERHAEKNGMNVNQYARVAVLMDMAFDGNPEALKIIFSGVRDNFCEFLGSRLKRFEASKPELV